MAKRCALYFGTAGFLLSTWCHGSACAPVSCLPTGFWPDAKIEHPANLGQAGQVRLDRQLPTAALERAKEDPPKVLAREVLGRGYGTVGGDVLKDKWLPTLDAVDCARTMGSRVTELMRAVTRCGIAWTGSITVPPPGVPPAEIEKAHKRAEADVRRLLAAGADVNARDQQGETALSAAVTRCRPAMVKILLEAGADANAKNKDGETALMRAVWLGGSDKVELLLARGADVNATDSLGHTALRVAIGRERVALVQRLLAAGATANARDASGIPLLTFAATKHPNAVEPLLRGGADVNARDTKGNTALMWAAQGGIRVAVASLIAAGADVNAKNKQGETALSAAMRKGRTEITNLLRQAGAKE